jgi:hypothetical protein
MKLITIIACAIIALGSVLSLEAAVEKKAKSGTLYHVVSLKFKDSATPVQIKEVEAAFKALKNKISGIKSLKSGTNVSPEKMNKGFTHCFVLTFKSDKDRDAYLVHPDHQAFGKSLGPVLEEAMVIDFWAKKK